MRWFAVAFVSLAVALGGCRAETGGFGVEPDSDDEADGGMGDDKSQPFGNGPRGAGDGGLPQLDAASLPPVMVADACDAAGCSIGQRCEVDDDGDARCIDLECEELVCDDGQGCQAHPAGGHVCAAAGGCETSVDCLADEYCDDDGACQPDVCSAGARSCDGETVLACDNDGSAAPPRFSCGSSAHFATSCSDDGAGSASCTCEGDWDCPAFTRCEAGLCAGTGLQPTCSLPPIPFADTPPQVELEWGGQSQADSIAYDGTPARNEAHWSQFAHVVNTPVVANLDDDNGDGLINELDFPEILFVAHEGNNPWDDGVLRVIHGGGPNKGAEYFARCGAALYPDPDDPLADPPCTGANPDADSGAPVAVADLDNDGVPEVLYPKENETVVVLDNRGRLLLQTPIFTADNEGSTIAVANLDFAGYAEIIVGATVFVLGDDADGNLIVTHRFVGGGAVGRNDGVGSMVCPADLVPARAGQEIVAGATLYALPETIDACATPPCDGVLDVIWDATTVSGNEGKLSGEGYCAVADVWGATGGMPPGPDHPPDGVPEVVLIDDGHLSILDGATGLAIDDRDLGGGGRGGAPNVDDFDGDGFMEIASALQNFYVVVDLQASTGAGGNCPDWPDTIARLDLPDDDDNGVGDHNPNPVRTPGGSCVSDADCAAEAACNTAVGACVCLHNGWERGSDDDSSRATSSSVFDFNGDGAAEVIYNDECELRIYDGVSGEVEFAAKSRSRTGIENPVVADVDNDGNAEVVFGTNTAVNNRCVEDEMNNGGVPTGPNGLRVWGDPTDTWVSARRIWNQQSYHVTNVTEGGAIPMHPPESWGQFNGRRYNTYRSQPRSFGVAPDLVVSAIGVFSPDAACGSLSDNIDIAVEIENEGDLRVGPGVRVRFEGRWGDDDGEALLDGAGDPLSATLDASLEPGRSVAFTINFDQADNGRATLPDSVRVIVDPAGDGQPDGAERECREDNNSLEALVEAGQQRAELSLTLGETTSPCPGAEVETTIHNDGSAAASDILVRYYAGNPSSGGTVLHQQTVAGPVEAGESVTFTATIPSFPPGRAITVYAIVDPDRAIDECNEANNAAAADDPILCVTSPD